MTHRRSADPSNIQSATASKALDGYHFYLTTVFQLEPHITTVMHHARRKMREMFHLDTSHPNMKILVPNRS